MIRVSSTADSAATGGKPQYFGRRLLAGVLLINLMAVILAIVGLATSYQDDIRQIGTRTRNLAEATESNITSAFQKVDVVLLTIVDELERGMREGGTNAGRANAFLMRQQQHVTEIDGIRVTNAAGEVYLGQGARTGATANYADREFFVIHRGNANAGLDRRQTPPARPGFQ